MAGEFRILPIPGVARVPKRCPLLEDVDDAEAWTGCCTQLFRPMARCIADGDAFLADDALQESWIKVLRHIRAYQGSAPACAWVRAIVRNCCLDLLRQRQEHPQADVGAPESVPDPEPSPEERAQRREAQALLREMIATLPAIYREVCELRYGEGLSEAQTANLLNISRSCVSTRACRAVRMLKAQFDELLLGKSRGASAGPQTPPRHTGTAGRQR